MTQATKQAFIDALERLIKGEPTNLKLNKKAKKGKLKVNDNTVEQEAGLSVGSLRNHTDIKDMIKARTLNSEVESSNFAESEVDLLQTKIKKLKSEKTQLNKLKIKHLTASRKNEEALATQAALHIKMVQELMEMIPESQREKAMDKIVNTRPDNVIKGSFR